MNATKKLRAAVIGLGPIGNLHADIYREGPLSELVGVCDLLPDRAEAAGRRLGVPHFPDAGKMLAALRPDVVSVATGGVEYGSDHYEPTLQALEAGAHVLCEKPICNEIPKAVEMVARARALGRCFGVNLNHRFTPAARLARKWLDEGRIGPLLFCNMAMWIKNPNESSPWFQIKALHPHTVDIMRHFCGDVAAVQCFATKAPGRQIWSTAHFSLQFRNGAVGGLTGSYDVQRGHPMERCEVAGTNGRFVIDDMWREATLYGAGDPVKLVYTNPVFGGMRGFDDTFRNRINAFVEQVAAGCRPEAIDGSGADGLAAQKVLDAAIRSVKERRIVMIDEE
jgi:predicted dehydrogenase